MIMEKTVICNNENDNVVKFGFKENAENEWLNALAVTFVRFAEDDFDSDADWAEGEKSDFIEWCENANLELSNAIGAVQISHDFTLEDLMNIADAYESGKKFYICPEVNDYDDFTLQRRQWIADKAGDDFIIVDEENKSEWDYCHSDYIVKVPADWKMDLVDAWQKTDDFYEEVKSAFIDNVQGFDNEGLIEMYAERGGDFDSDDIPTDEELYDWCIDAEAESYADCFLNELTEDWLEVA